MSVAAVAAVGERFQKEIRAPLGFAFADLRSGERVAFRGEEAFPTASAFKVFVLAELFRAAEAGDCALDERVELTEAGKCIGSGVMALMDGGLRPTLKDLATLMIIISDNTATDLLMARLGKENIRKNVIESLGFRQNRCDLTCEELVSRCYQMGGLSKQEVMASRGFFGPAQPDNEYFRCTAAENNQASPLEMLRLMELVYRGEWVSRRACDGMLAILKACQTNRRIPRHLPIGTVVAHKTGTLDRLAVDAGIVYTPKGDYALSLFYNGNLAPRADYDANVRRTVGDDVLADISLAVYEAYMEDKNII